jgi:hypothetical protein
VSDQITPGQQLFAIISSTTVTPYPVFTGCQATLYGDLITAFNEALQADGLRTVTDLRTDVYADPEYYLPTTVQGIIQNTPQPPIPAGCQVSDWTAVYDQISTEVAYLVQLYDFQTILQLGTLAVNQAMATSFAVAQTTINDNSSNGFLSVLDFLSDIVSLGFLFDDLDAITTIVGTYLACLTAIPGGDGVEGELDELQTQLATIIDQANTAAGNVYAPICNDWGKLQQFNALLPSLSGQSQNQADYQTIGNLYEISVYQAVLPSIMAVVSYPAGDSPGWGCCASPSATNVGLGYTPTENGSSDYSSGICSRLTTLGVNLDDVCAQSGGWSGLPLWECVITGNPHQPTSCSIATPEIDSNVVWMTGAMITNIAYLQGSLMVTQGQLSSPDVETALAADSTDMWCITASANRSGSSDVASSFIGKVGGAGHAYCPSSSSTKTPGKLNFYFAVSITVETSSGPVIVTPVYFGQGHTFIHNNWWIGGSAVKYDGSGPAYLAVGSGQFSISGGTSSFELSS